MFLDPLLRSLFSLFDDTMLRTATDLSSYSFCGKEFLRTVFPSILTHYFKCIYSKLVYFLNTFGISTPLPSKKFSNIAHIVLSVATKVEFRV